NRPAAAHAGNTTGSGPEVQRVHSAIQWLREHRDPLLFAVTTGLLGAGGVGYLAGARTLATALWVAATLLGLIYSAGTIAAALRRRQPSVDLIAFLALGGALLVDEAF